MAGFRFQQALWLPEPPERVFPFFAEARNLEAITPPWLRFRVLNEGEIRMGVGTRIDYRLRIHGLPLRWQSEITAWEPPWRFVDSQRRGPYRFWIHEHRFEAADGGTRVLDSVDYLPPGGWLSNRLFVAREVRAIFAHRAAALRRQFPGRS